MARVVRATTDRQSEVSHLIFLGGPDRREAVMDQGADKALAAGQVEPAMPVFELDAQVEHVRWHRPTKRAVASKLGRRIERDEQ